MPGSCTFQGFDISCEQFMPAKQLPPNVRLSTLDATKEPPEDLKNQFDVVHMRFMQSILSDDDPNSLIRHCANLLRMSNHITRDSSMFSKVVLLIATTRSGPGGILQLDELDPSTLEGPSPENGPVEHLGPLISDLDAMRPTTSVN